MAVSWNADAKVSRTGQGYSVDPLNVITLNDLSGRFEATDVTALAQSIKANGQRQPALCWKNDEGWPVVAAGHRRLRAILQLNEQEKDPEQEVESIVQLCSRLRRKSEAFTYTVIENRDRLNPSPLDDGHNQSDPKAEVWEIRGGYCKNLLPGNLYSRRTSKSYPRG